jgi:hypothetical protein
MPNRFPYPSVTELTPSHLTEAFDIITNRKFDRKNFQILVNTEYGLQGIAFGFYPGMPDSFGSWDHNLPATNELINTNEFGHLERCCDSYLLTEKRFGGENDITASQDAEAIDPATILFIITSIVELIKLLKKKKR